MAATLVYNHLVRSNRNERLIAVANILIAIIINITNNGDDNFITILIITIMNGKIYAYGLAKWTTCICVMHTISISYTHHMPNH